MGLFSKSSQAAIEAVATKAVQALQPASPGVAVRSVREKINSMQDEVVSYFKDSEAELITTEERLHEYVTDLIASGFAGIDTETTGLDRYNDHVVGSSLYYPGGHEVYIPNKHKIPIMEDYYSDQLSYEAVAKEFERIREAGVKLIFANADFDLAMIYHDFNVDFCDNCYYDVLIAWRCLKENELHNNLKALYNKYVLKGQGDPRRFTDFFTPDLFPYCKPSIAKLYAANDAKITYELFKWQLPYCTKDHPKCKKNHLEAIADLIWNVEFPMIKVCQQLFRTGIYIDQDVAKVIRDRYNAQYEKEIEVLQNMVQDLIDNTVVTTATKRPFRTGKDFNPNSQPHAKYLIYDLLKVPQGKKAGTGKDVIADINLPVTNQILKVRSTKTLISTFTDKLWKSTTPDGRIHAQFKQIGAATGRLSSAEPNLQNIPSHAMDIRHMFRATPGYVLLSSDYSAQEPRITAFLANDEKMIDAFIHGRDVYANIASIAYGVPYEQCLEFHPETHEYQPDGKARRGEAKFILLGICYGRSVPSIAEQLYGTRTDMSDDEKIKKAQKVYDAVLNSFPGLRNLMVTSEAFAKKYGYVETILGRRRHLPDMRLPEFEFKPIRGYVNPDIDPLSVSSLENKEQIPERVIAQLQQEFGQYKWFGQIARRTKELYENDKIRVINNRPKINDSTRQVVNSRIQGSAADMTKMAMLRLSLDPEWQKLGGRLLIPVHDELIAEVPIENAEKGGEVLSRCMVEAADFLPFPIKCDVETTYRWYGLDYKCPYTEPTSIDTENEDEVKWIQYQLCEMEYLLPVFKEEDGSKPKGDAAKGVNGKITDEYHAAIKNYMSKYRVSAEDFISDIRRRVIQGS